MGKSLSNEFRLYIAGSSPNSIEAIRNIHALCAEHLNSCHRIEVIDVLVSAQAAFEDGVLVTPTLVRLSPRPEIRIVGTLAPATKVLALLGISADPK